MDIGANIKRLRKEAGLKQKDLAKELKVSDKTISSWESNRTEPDMGAVAKICEVLKCRCTDIMGNNGFAPDLPSMQLSNREQRLITYYRMLNETDKQSVDKNVYLLAQNEKRVKRDVSEESSKVG